MGLYNKKVLSLVFCVGLVACQTGSQRPSDPLAKENATVQSCQALQDKFLSLNGTDLTKLVRVMAMDSANFQGLGDTKLESCLDEALSITCRQNEACEIKRK